MLFTHHQTISLNKKGKDFVVSDIHGNFTLLTEILKSQGFNPDKDRVFSVGDIIDRGGESEMCLNLLLTPWFKPVLGNHELMLVSFLDDPSMIDAISKNGGGWLNKHLDSPAAIRRWVELIKLRMPIAMTIETQFGFVGITHAQPPENWEDVKNPNTEYINFLTSRDQIKQKLNYNVKNITFTVHGHSDVKTITRIKNRFWIDTLEYTGKPCVKTLDELYFEMKNER